MDKYEILQTIKEKMENCEGGFYGFINWLQEFIDEQLKDEPLVLTY